MKDKRKTHLAFDEHLKRQVVSTKIGHDAETPRRDLRLFALTTPNEPTHTFMSLTLHYIKVI